MQEGKVMVPDEIVRRHLSQENMWSARSIKQQNLGHFWHEDHVCKSCPLCTDEQLGLRKHAQLLRERNEARFAKVESVQFEIKRRSEVSLICHLI
jgi:hypothetical protein